MTDLHKIGLTHKKKRYKKKSIQKTNVSLNPEAQLKLLSEKLGISEKILADLCVKMYQLYKDEI
ncbi:MAG: hypothetical protein ACMV0K_00090 [Sulfurospirillum sp.]|jgi:hypothetical protein